MIFDSIPTFTLLYMMIKLINTSIESNLHYVEQKKTHTHTLQRENSEKQFQTGL